MSLIMNAADDLTLTLIYAGFGILTFFVFLAALAGRDIPVFEQLRESSPTTSISEAVTLELSQFRSEIVSGFDTLITSDRLRARGHTIRPIWLV